ncbi:MAG: peptidylprolyl isomerase, partial [Muribaculum sp.]|nr:peptidylprolyl isomerase [Muribaculum sp.]
NNIYQVLLAGSDFADMARKVSEDPGSARNGGQLPWFGAGQMVPEFEQVSFELADSTISKPFKTSYGWHIVKKQGHRNVMPLEEMRSSIMSSMARDERATMPREKKFRELRARYNASLKEQNIETLNLAIERAGRLDSALLDIFTTTPMVFAVVNGTEYTCDDVLADLDLSSPLAATLAVETVKDVAQQFVDNRVVDLEMARLEKEDRNFANLLREYRDGMLMFEQSNKKVWAAAATDPTALEQYFEANRGNYRFDPPKFKGIVILTANDSVSQAAKDYIKANNLGVDSLAHTLRKNVNKIIRVEKVLVEKGKNQVVDEDFFGEPKAPVKENARYKSHFIYEGKLIDAPEEIADIRTQLVTDYQNSLNQTWIDELKEKYPVKVNRKVLKQIK